MIAPALPARTGNGLAMRLGVFLGALSSVADVDLVVPTAAAGAATNALIGGPGVRLLEMPGQGEIDTQFSLLSRLRDPAERIAAFRAFGRPSLAAAVTERFKAELGGLARERGYALVHVGRSYLMEAGVAAAKDGATLSVDLDEDDLASYESQAAALRGCDPGSAFSADWLSAEGAACDRLVAAHGDRYSRIWIAGPQDLAALGKRHPHLAPRLLPNGVEVPAEPRRRPQAGQFLFVGTLGYLPNRLGIEWFVDQVWPRVCTASPSNPRLVIAGAGVALHGKSEADRAGISMLGYVGDLQQLYETAAVFVAPLFSGGGTRIKLLEAAAHAVPIVTTSIAVQGLPFSDPESAWIADQPETFARACVDALANPAEAERRAASARALVREHQDRDAIVRGLASEFAELLG